MNGYFEFNIKLQGELDTLKATEIAKKVNIELRLQDYQKCVNAYFYKFTCNNWVISDYKGLKNYFISIGFEKIIIQTNANPETLTSICSKWWGDYENMQSNEIGLDDFIESEGFTALQIASDESDSDFDSYPYDFTIKVPWC